MSTQASSPDLAPDSPSLTTMAAPADVEQKEEAVHEETDEGMQDVSINSPEIPLSSDPAHDAISSSSATAAPSPPIPSLTPSLDVHPSSPASESFSAFEEHPPSHLSTFPPPAVASSFPLPSTTTPETTLPVPSRPSSASSASSIDPAETSKPAVVHGVALVGFDHQLGPTIEFTYPPELLSNDLTQNLPFLALPDGAHARDEDYSYFHMLLPSIAPDTIFGISCNRQIPADELINKGKDVTRSTVQKAIVVLASKPIFGPLREKLGVITRAFFAQKDFDDKSILVDLYSSLEIPTDPTLVSAGGAPKGDDEEGGMYMGTSLRELVHKFRFKTLMLLKLIMLQRKVMFYAAHSSVEQLCTFQYSLVALIPALLTHLEDAASPTLDERSKNTTRPTSLRTSDKQSLLRYLGLPLNIFGQGSFFQPYLPLQQIDLLQTRSYLVGTTNSIFQQQRDCKIDVIVNLDSGSLEILNPRLIPFITLTAADRKWMDEIVTTVESSWNPTDPGRPTGMNFVGSDDFLRAKFEEYICSLLACIKFKDFLAKGERGDVLISGAELDTNMMSAFNEGFIKAFQATPAFTLWDATTDSVIFDLVEPRHPMDGKTNAIEDVGIRLAHGLHSLHLEENLAAPAREAITRGITTGSDSIWKTYAFLRSDLNKRQAEYREKREKEKTNPSPAGSSAMDPAPLIASTVFAGVDVAKTGAASLATGIGSFLSARRTQLFPTADAPKTTSRSTSPSRRNSGLSPPSNESSAPATLPSFLRPLSTSSLASVASSNPSSVNLGTPPPSAGISGVAGGFFNTLRRSFSENATPPPSTPPEPRESEEIDIPIRDLDAEYAARQAATASKEADDFEVVPREPLGLTEVTERPPSDHGHDEGDERHGLLGKH